MMWQTDGWPPEIPVESVTGLYGMVIKRAFVDEIDVGP